PAPSMPREAIDAIAARLEIAPARSMWPMWKLMIGVALLALGALGAISIAVWPHDPPPSIAPRVEQAHVDPPAPIEVARVDEPIEIVQPEDQIVEPAPQPIARARRAQGDVTSEVRLLEQARGALSSDPARALALTDQHKRTFPRGQLVAEREVLA